MSFGDLERSGGGARRAHVPLAGTSSEEVNAFERASHAIFTISSNVANIQRLVTQFGTRKDSAEMRAELHGLTEDTREMVRRTGADLKTIMSTGTSSSLSTPDVGERQRKMRQQKLQKDFEEVLRRFQSVSKLAAEKSREYVQIARAAQAGEYEEEDDAADTPLITAHQRHQLAALDSEIQFNETLIQEREQDLVGIEQSIQEVNEIFRDLGTLVHEQGYMLDNIESNVQSVEINMENATSELRVADRYQRSKRNKLCCIITIITVIVLVLVLVIIT
ncbi:t-SNARE [Gaertneriomyces semiglobifer]|nr:t-SNARE [Gaertneriomyces semiglobifer]